MMDKELIKKRFKKSLKTYNSHATVQNSMTDNLVCTLIKLKGDNFDNILEIGCGTGYLTKRYLMK